MRRLTGVKAFGVCAALVVALGATSVAAGASNQYPVPYNFAANIAAAALQPQQARAQPSR